MKKRILLINPPATRRAYLETNVSVGAPVLPSLGLAALGGELLRNGHEASVLDLDLADISGRDTDRLLGETLRGLRPDAVGITSITPTWHEAMRIAASVKQALAETIVICGGVHATRFPEDTLEDGSVDFVAMGESDYTICELLESDSPEAVEGIACRYGNGEVRKSRRPLINDLDALAMPAWELFDTGRYRMSHLTERHRPGGYIETSRGCPFGCIYCDKTTFGKRFRAKSAERVVDEIEYMKDRHDFRELHIVDDGFTTNIERAKEICRMMIERNARIPFNLFNGIRADRVDGEVLDLMKEAGCYQVAFGVESGNDAVLESVSKGLTKDDIRRAVALCRKRGLETFGFFIIGLPADTAGTVNDTIRFAVELDMTISKFDIAVPLPGTPMFETLDSRGLIKSKDWRRYIFHRTDNPIYEHPNMSWEEIKRLYGLAYRRVYLRPKYIAKRFVYSLRTGSFFKDAKSFLKAGWH